MLFLSCNQNLKPFSKKILEVFRLLLLIFEISLRKTLNIN